MVIAVTVSGRGYIFLVSQLRRSHGMGAGIFLVVFLDDARLHRIGEGSDHEARLLLQRHAAYDDAVAGYLHCAFGAGENQAFVLFASIDEVHAQTQVETLWIIKETHHYVGHVAAVFPEAQASGCHGSRGPMRAGDEVSSAEEVNEEIACHAAAVGLPLAPLEKVLTVKGNLGSGAEKAWPITGFGRGIGRYGVIPGPDGRVAIPVRGHHIQFSDGAGSEQFLRLGIDHRTDALAADLDYSVGRVCGLDHLWPVGIEMDHRLLAINVLAGFHGVHGDLFMPVVGRAYDDGIDVFALQDLAVVAGGKDIVAPEFLAVLQPAVVAIRDGDELHAGNLHCNLGVSLALATGADQRDLNMIVGCDRWGRFGLSSASKCVLDPSNVSAVAAAPTTLRKLLRFSSCTVVLTYGSYPPSVTIQLKGSGMKSTGLLSTRPVVEGMREGTWGRISAQKL